MAPSPTDRLDPVGRLRLPRRPTLVRATLVAALLLTAAGVLYAGAEPARPASGTATGPDPGAEGSSDPSGPGAEGSSEAGAPGSGSSDPGRPAGPGSGVTDPAGPAGAADNAPPGHPPGGPERLPIPPGLVGVPVALGDPGRLAVLRPGDRVDLLAVPAAGGEPVPLASGAPVLAVDHAAATLLLAVTPEQGRAVLAEPAASTTFAVIIRGWPGPDGSVEP
jgi:hypothetical protein